LSLCKCDCGLEKFTQKFHSATGGAATVLAIFLFPVKETLISFLPSEHIMTLCKIGLSLSLHKKIALISRMRNMRGSNEFVQPATHVASEWKEFTRKVLISPCWNANPKMIKHKDIFQKKISPQIFRTR
jgi:hypothetical protein